MSILDKIKADQLIARKEKSAIKAQVLTTLLGELDTGAKRDGKIPGDTEVLALIQKFIKNIDETIKAMGTLTIETVSSPKTVQLLIETQILESYLPQQLTEDELRVIIDDCIMQEQCGGDLSKGTSMGAVMSYLKIKYSGRYDGKVASQISKELCS